MNFSSSPSYPQDFAKVAVLLMGISLFQAEEELMKLTTNNQQRILTINNYGDYDYANLLEY